AAATPSRAVATLSLVTKVMVRTLLIEIPERVAGPPGRAACRQQRQSGAGRKAMGRCQLTIVRVDPRRTPALASSRRRATAYPPVSTHRLPQCLREIRRPVARLHF